MKMISYRFSLDCHKSGSQKYIQGIHQGDSLTHRAVITLSQSGVPVPVSSTMLAYMVIKKGSVKSVQSCSIEDNEITYDFRQSDFSTAGVIECIVKVMHVSADGVESLLYSPSFSVEVQANDDIDTDENVPEYSALDTALAQAQYYYNKRFQSISLDDDFTVTITFGDGTEYNFTDLQPLKDISDNEAQRQQTYLEMKSATESAQEFVSRMEGIQYGISPRVETEGQNIIITDAYGSHTFSIDNSQRVNLTRSGNVYSIDCTPGEIATWLASGKSVYLVESITSDLSYSYCYSGKSTEKWCFTSVRIDDGVAYIRTVSVDDEGEISLEVWSNETIYLTTTSPYTPSEIESKGITTARKGDKTYHLSEFVNGTAVFCNVYNTFSGFKAEIVTVAANKSVTVTERKSKTFSKSLLADDWTLNDGMYEQEVTLAITPNETPIIDYYPNGSLEQRESQAEAWSAIMLNPVAVETGKLVFYADEEPEVDIDLNIKVVM